MGGESTLICSKNENSFVSMKLFAEGSLILVMDFEK